MQWIGLLLPRFYHLKRFPILALWSIVFLSFGETNQAPPGVASAKPAKTLNVGDVAPLFEVRTLENNYVSLSESKGKYVLLVFWATSSADSLAEMRSVRAAFEASDGDSRFACIGLCLDATKDAPLKFVEERRLHWPQGFLRDWSKTTLPGEYGVRTLPSVWLIGPDGKVFAKDLKGEKIKSAVEKVLSR
jgi:peroxiredoxin